jgi:hypothetical protein
MTISRFHPDNLPVFTRNFNLFLFLALSVKSTSCQSEVTYSFCRKTIIYETIKTIKEGINALIMKRYLCQKRPFMAQSKQIKKSVINDPF